MQIIFEILFKSKNVWSSYVKIFRGPVFWRHRPPLFHVCQVANVVMETVQRM